MQGYPFSRYSLNPVPCSRLRVPLQKARVALVTSAGLHLSSQPGFDRRIKTGDPSFREIPENAELPALREGHKSQAYDHSGVESDRNLALPLDRFRELAEFGEIGSINHRHFSFMGSIVYPRRLIAETAPLAASRMLEDQVDFAFLTPV